MKHLTQNQLNDPKFISSIVAQVIREEEGTMLVPKKHDTLVLLRGKKQKVTINFEDFGTPLLDTLSNVTIEWRFSDGVTVERFKNLNFKPEDVLDDYGNEGKNMAFMAMSSDEKYIFMVDVSVDANFESNDIIQNIDWDSLEIDDTDYVQPRGGPQSSQFAGAPLQGDLEEGSCGFNETTTGKKLKTPGGTRGMPAITRTNFMKAKSS